MVCPMANKGPSKEVVTEYPYESLYRPWSWALSSLFNIFLFMALTGILYFYYRKRKSSPKSFVTYRTRVVRQREEGSGKKVALVTGGNGGLGKELARMLSEDDEYEVHSLDLLLPQDACINAKVYSYIQADIMNKNDLLIALKDVEVVFHCAALLPYSLRNNAQDIYTVNCEGTRSVVDACKECGVKRLLYTSSASVALHKDPKQACVDSDESCPLPDDPFNPYVASKGAAERYVRDANDQGGLKTCILRPNAIVEGMYSILSNNLYGVSGYDFELSVVSFSSAAKAHILAEEKLVDNSTSSVVAGKAYNVGEEKLRVAEFTSYVAKEKNVQLTSFPLAFVRFLAKLNELVFWLTGKVAISPYLTSASVSYKTHTFVCQRARQDLGWVQGTPWKEVVHDLVKREAEEKERKKEK